MNDKQRFKIDEENGCWIWTGAAVFPNDGPDGYGMVRLDGKIWLVHRLSYTIFKGPIHSGLDAHHTCPNTLCFNPDHLQAIESGEHTKQHKRHPACRYGHPRTGDNFMVRKDGHIVCLACRRERYRKKQEKEKSH